MNTTKIDLHCHSNASDGKYSPAEIINRAYKNNVKILALTDHDTIKGLSSALEEAKNKDMIFIPGIELSTFHNNENIHVLGYFKDDSYKNSELVSFLSNLNKKRKERAIKIIHNLDTYYNIKLDVDKVLSLANGVVARPHIAKDIIDAGYNYEWDYIFDNFIGNNSKAYVPNEKISTEEGIKLLKKYNCVVVLAHPVLIKKSPITDFLSMGFDGFEAYYFQNFKKDTERLSGICNVNNLLCTCGSDFHGIDDNDSKHGDIGDMKMPEKYIDEFLKFYNS